MTKISLFLILIITAAVDGAAQRSEDYIREVALRLYERSAVAPAERFKEAFERGDDHIIDSVCAAMIASIERARIDTIDTVTDRNLLDHLFFPGCGDRSIASTLSSEEGRSTIARKGSSVLHDLRRMRDTLSRRGALNRDDQRRLYYLYFSHSAQALLPSLWFLQIEYHPTYGLTDALSERFFFYDMVSMVGLDGLPWFMASMFSPNSKEERMIVHAEIRPYVARSMIDDIPKISPSKREAHALEINALTAILTLGMREDLVLVLTNGM